MRAALALALVCCGGAVTPPAPPPAPRPIAAAPAVAESRPAFAARIDAVFETLTKGKRPGCAVGVYRAGEIVYAKGYGYADLEHDVPITDTSVFDIGSVSKQFTAAAIVLLAQDKKLSLDDDVRKYVPELPDYGARITLSHLLHHTSGLRDYAGLLMLAAHTSEDLTDEEDALFVVAHQHALNFAPGTQFAYSNTGYFLLGLVVKRISGQPLAAFAKERIFEPLGMSGTHIHDDHTLLVPGRAIGYAPHGPRFGVAMSDFEQVGARAVMTTVRDLARWDANFYTPRVGGQALVDALRTRGTLASGATIEYALGLVVGEENGVAVEHHDGAWAGYRAVIMRLPIERVGAAVVCNTQEQEPEDLVRDVLRVFVPKLGEPRPSEPGKVEPAHLEIDPATLAGAYLAEEGEELRVIEVKDGTMRMRFTLDDRGEGREVVAVGPRELVVRGTQTRYAIEPKRIVRKPVDGSANTAFARFEPVTSVPAAKLAEYAGRYGSDEIPHDLEFVARDGKLFVANWGRKPERLPVSPIKTDVFVVGPFGLRFVRDARGKVKTLLVDAPRMRGVRFERR